ncbi:MAG: hypothetical protein AAFQ53_01160 [Bacteroidota bacterium]
MHYASYLHPTRWASLLALTCVLLLSACDTLDDTEGVAAAPQAFSSASGSATDHRITFQTQKEFEEVYALLAAGDESDLNAYEKERGFTSMRSAEASDANATKKGNMAPEDAYVGVIEDPVLATLVSPQGLIQIGEALYKVGEEYVFEGTKYDAEYFASSEESDLRETKNTSAFRIIRETPHIPDPNGPGPEIPEPSDPDTTSAPTPPPAPSRAHAQLGSRYRLNGHSFITDFGFIAIAGVTTSVKKRGWFGIYFPVRGDVLSHTATFGSTTVSNTCTRAFVCYSVVSVSIPGPLTGTLSTTHNATHAGDSATVQTSVTVE